MAIKLNLSQILNIISVIAPAILSAIPETSKYAKLITAALLFAEETLKSGPEKRVIAKEIIMLGVESANKIQPNSLIASKAGAVYENSVDVIMDTVNEIAKIEPVAIVDKEVNPGSIEGIFAGQ